MAPTHEGNCTGAEPWPRDDWRLKEVVLEITVRVLTIRRVILFDSASFILACLFAWAD